jgi:hypothetical protein
VEDTPSYSQTRHKREDLTYAQIERAATDILKSGIRPTVEGVRNALGVGSPRTILNGLNRYWRDLGSQVAGTPYTLRLVVVSTRARLKWDRGHSPNADNRALVHFYSSTWKVTCHSAIGCRNTLLPYRIKTLVVRTKQTPIRMAFQEFRFIQRNLVAVAASMIIPGVAQVFTQPLGRPRLRMSHAPWRLHFNGVIAATHTATPITTSRR